jgi:hypothetical protein
MTKFKHTFENKALTRKSVGLPRHKRELRTQGHFRDISILCWQ